MKHAACLLQQQRKQDNDQQLPIEEECLLQAVWAHFDSRLMQPHQDKLNDILQAHYPNTFPRLVVQDEKTLKEAIESEITARHLQCTPLFVNKVCCVYLSVCTVVCSHMYTHTHTCIIYSLLY